MPMLDAWLKDSMKVNFREYKLDRTESGIYIVMELVLNMLTVLIPLLEGQSHSYYCPYQLRIFFGNFW